MNKPNVFFLLGPTASGKTKLAVKLVQQFPFEIISVDSAMVYRGLNIGASKPTEDELHLAPHRLIDIRDPKEIYSVGHFLEDAVREIKDIHAKNKIPLLVGGTMMYFNILQKGLADLPKANRSVRQSILERADEIGWPALHHELAHYDPEAAKKIHPNDQQRIQRALEVYHLTGNIISTLQQKVVPPMDNYTVHAFAIAPHDRKILHEKIAKRFAKMLEAGFVDEVRVLYERDDITAALPALRSVGYAQVWQFLDGKYDYATMRSKGIAATRQLAKRQLTWLRSWENLTWFESENENVFAEVKEWVKDRLSEK